MNTQYALRISNITYIYGQNIGFRQVFMQLRTAVRDVHMYVSNTG